MFALAVELRTSAQARNMSTLGFEMVAHMALGIPLLITRVQSRAPRLVQIGIVRPFKSTAPLRFLRVTSTGRGVAAPGSLGDH
jgi:hypothetical protein